MKARDRASILWANDEPEIISFTVYGRAIPQGSKVRTQYGMREDNEKLKPWRDLIGQVAGETMEGRPLLTGPVRLEVRADFVRPKSHYGTGRNADKLKPSATLRHAQKPDIDKICRAVADALTGIAYRDDSQIVSLVAHKFWGPRDSVYVTVEPVRT